MRFDGLFSLLSTLGHLSFVESQSRRCKEVPNSLGMRDLVNFGCKLVLGAYAIKYQNICEGEPCPGLGNSNTICSQGKCVDRIKRPPIETTKFPTLIRFITIEPSDFGSGPLPTHSPNARPTARRRPVKGAGRLLVSIIRAEIPNTDDVFNSEPDSYIVLCLHQDAKRESPTSALSERSGCTCRTSKIEDDNNPSWGHECDAWDLNKSQHNSTVLTFEAYDNEFISSDEFIGSTDITVLDVFKSNSNRKELQLDLTGPYPSKLTVNVTWIPIK